MLRRNFTLDREERPEDWIQVLQFAREIARPTLIVGCDNDPVFPVRRALYLLERITDRELFVLLQRHFLHRTMAGIFNEALLNLLRSHAASYMGSRPKR